MKSTTYLSTAILMLALGASGMVWAEEGAEISGKPPGMHDGKGPGAKDWQHHNELMELLPDDKRKILIDAMEKSHEQNKGLWEQARKLHEERDALLKAPTFDEAAYLKKNAEIDALHEKLKQSHEKTFASVASQFSPQERRVLLVMEHMMHHHHKGGEWTHHEHAPAPEGEAHQPS